MDDKRPNLSKPIDIKAFCHNHLLACGCSELAVMLELVKALLTQGTSKEYWPSFGETVDRFFGGVAASAYFVFGILDHAELTTHGIAIRYPIITDFGKKFLRALNENDLDAVEAASGYAYDGLYYFGEEDMI